MTISSMRYLSPLRYPGGKSSLASFLADVIDLNDLRGCPYYEPYAGGAGAALRLMAEGLVSEIHINDADYRVHAFWQSALTESDRFVSKLLSVPLTLSEWRRQRTICVSPAGHPTFEVGFAAFYMNRCNRSGVLSGAGPIGGLEQNGKWRLAARFSRDSLAERILALGRIKARIHLTRLDALAFLKSGLPTGRARKRVFVYLDPPYVNKGRRLYLNAYTEKDHAKLAAYVTCQACLRWVMSYDDTSLVRALYVDHQIAKVPIRYSLQEKRPAQELIVAPHSVTLPRTCFINGEKTSLNINREQPLKR
jgi:DNA adenine methylase